MARLTLRLAERLRDDAAPATEPLEAVHLTGPDLPTWNAYFTALARAIGAPELPAWSPEQLRRTMRLAPWAKGWQRLGLPGGERLALAPAAGELALFARKARYSARRLHELTGDRAIIDLTDGLERSLRP